MIGIGATQKNVRIPKIVGILWEFPELQGLQKLQKLQGVAGKLQSVGYTFPETAISCPTL